MKILEIYKNLNVIATTKFNDIITHSEIILSSAGLPRKLRLYLIDETYIDIYYSISGNFSYHWEQRIIRSSIYRHDNAPHLKWKRIPSYPKHLHNGSENNVKISKISNDPNKAIIEFLNEVKEKIMKNV